VTTSVAKTIEARVQGRVGHITLNRPPLNVLDTAMMLELDDAISQVVDRVDFLVLRGAGAKGFSAGAEVADHTPDRVRAMLAAFHSIFRRLARAECITIALVHGYCLGGGMELATFCDFVVASESAVFGQPEIKLGCFPPIAMISFPKLCGLHAAIDLILTGKTITANEAHRLGLVSRIEDESNWSNDKSGVLEELCALSPSVLQLTRKTLRKLNATDFEESLEEIERIYFDELMALKDASEGIRAFMERRTAVWHHD